MKQTRDTVRDATQSSWNYLFVAWLIACIGTLGSLFFSEVMDFVPCVLCWYQRIFMYPLVIVLLIAMFPFDRNAIRYALPLATIGWLIAVYHYLLYSGFIPESLQPCSKGVSCADANLELLGFITIPFLSIVAFSAIIASLVVAKHRSQP